MSTLTKSQKLTHIRLRAVQIDRSYRQPNAYLSSGVDPNRCPCLVDCRNCGQYLWLSKTNNSVDPERGRQASRPLTFL